MPPSRRRRGPRPAQGRPAQGRPAQGRPAQGRPAQGRPARTRSTDNRAAGNPPAGHRPAPAGAALLVYLRTRPRWAVGAAVLALVLAGLFVPGRPAALLLLVVAVLLGWLARFSWPALDTPARAARVLVVAIVLAAAAAKAAGHG